VSGGKLIESLAIDIMCQCRALHGSVSSIEMLGYGKSRGEGGDASLLECGGRKQLYIGHDSVHFSTTSKRTTQTDISLQFIASGDHRTRLPAGVDFP
jgi:hypothetical protein